MVGDIKEPPAPAVRRLETLTQCPLCNSPSLLAAPLQPDPPFGMQQCAQCGGIFLSPRPPAAAMGAYYDEFYDGQSTERSSREERRARRHVRRLAHYSQRRGRLLEVGAGDGHVLNAARNDGWQVEGVELSQPRIARAREWFNLDLKCVDIMTAAYEPESFDAVAMMQLLEHLHDPRGVLKRVHGLLRPQGILIASTPNVLAYARKNRDVNSWRIPRHLFFFSPQTLVRTVENVGFEVVRWELRFYARLEKRFGWQPWAGAGLLSKLTRDLWTPFGLHLVARKR